MRRNPRAIGTLFSDEAIATLATSLKGRKDGGKVDVLDAAYWVKGCSSLGRLRYAVLLDIDGDVSDGDDLCLMDIKEGVTAAAPRDETATMPRDNAERASWKAHDICRRPSASGCGPRACSIARS